MKLCTIVAEGTSTPSGRSPEISASDFDATKDCNTEVVDWVSVT